MNETEILRNLIGWRCPCCGAIIAPSEKTCIYCNPQLRRMARDKNLGVEDSFFHDCPALR